MAGEPGLEEDARILEVLNAAGLGEHVAGGAAQGVDDELRRRASDAGPLAGADLDEADLAQVLERLAHRGPADAEVTHELALGRQPLRFRRRCRPGSSVRDAPQHRRKAGACEPVGCAFWHTYYTKHLVCKAVGGTCQTSRRRELAGRRCQRLGKIVHAQGMHNVMHNACTGRMRRVVKWRSGEPSPQRALPAPHVRAVDSSPLGRPGAAGATGPHKPSDPG